MTALGIFFVAIGVLLVIFGIVYILIRAIINCTDDGRKETKGYTEKQIKRICTRKANEHFCRNCGKLLEKNDSFCSYCGAAINLNTDCINCGEVIESTAGYCKYCGAPAYGKTAFI